MDVIRARRSARSVWDPNDWRREIECIKIQMGTIYLGVGKHGGSRSKPLATGNTDLDTVTGKRKSTDRDSDDVLASGSKDRSIEQLASGNKDRGIEQLASGNKDRGIDQLAPGSKDRGIEQLASGNKDRGSGRGVASESSAPGDTQHGVGQWHHHQSRWPLAAQVVSLCGMGSGIDCWGRLLDEGLLGQFSLSSGRMCRTATILGSLQW